MFSSVNSRSEYHKPLTESKQNPNFHRFCEPENNGPIISRSLITRRLQNLSAVLHISLLRRDTKRAERAFAMLLRCERHGVNLRTLWELGLEILLRSSVESKVKAEEFLARVRLASSDIGHHPTTEKQMVSLFSQLLILMIRHGQYKEALTEANNDLLNWPYSESPQLRCYASMLLAQFDAFQREAIQLRDTLDSD